MEYKKAITVLAAALFLRLVLYFIASADQERFFYQPDSNEYDILAVNLVENHSFSQSAEPPFLPDIKRTPVFPLFLSSIYFFSGYVPAVSVFFNLIISSCTCVIVFKIGRIVYNARAAFCAGLLLAIDFLSITYSNLLLTETLFTFLLTLGIYCLVYYYHVRYLPALVSAGIIIGTATLCRPVCMYLFLFLAPYFILISRQAGLVKTFRDYAVFSLCVLVFIVMWSYRNYYSYGISDLTSLTAINSYYHRAAPVLADVEGISLSESRERLRNRLEKEIGDNNLTVAEELNTMKLLAKQAIKNNILTYMKMHLMGTLRMFGMANESLYKLLDLNKDKNLYNFRVSENSGCHDKIRYIIYYMNMFFHIPVTILIYIASISGMWIVIVSRKYYILVLILLVICYFAIVSGPEAYARFRVPIMPFISLLAGLGISKIAIPPQKEEYLTGLTGLK